MTLQTFSFPYPETRFFRAGSTVYKFKIRGGSSFSGEEVIGEKSFHQELEDIIRTVLGNVDTLQPFSSSNFNIYPHKKPWEGCRKVMCKHDEKTLRAYPFILILDLERNPQNGKQTKKRRREIKKERHCSVTETLAKRCNRDSPLEEAILKELINDMEAESKITMVGRLQVNIPRAEGKVKEHVDKPGTEECDKPQLKSDVNMVRESESPADVPRVTTQDTGVEEAGDAPSARSGFLTRLASHIFPFSLFFRNR